MLIQSRQNITPQRQAFGAKLVANETVKQMLLQEMGDFCTFAPKTVQESFFGEKTPKPQEIWNGLTKAFEEETEDIPGEAKLDFPQDKKYSASITYSTGDEKYTAPNMILEDVTILFPDKTLDKNRPYRTAVRHLVAHISDSINKAWDGNDEFNPFRKLLDTMPYNSQKH